MAAAPEVVDQDGEIFRWSLVERSSQVIPETLEVIGPGVFATRSEQKSSKTRSAMPCNLCACAAPLGAPRASAAHFRSATGSEMAKSPAESPPITDRPRPRPCQGLRARTSTCGWQDACTQRRCCVWRGAARRNSAPHRRCAPCTLTSSPASSCCPVAVRLGRAAVTARKMCVQPLPPPPSQPPSPQLSPLPSPPPSQPP